MTSPASTDHSSVLIPLIRECSGPSAVTVLENICNYVALQGESALNSIASFFSTPSAKGEDTSLQLSAGFILKSILRKVQTERTEMHNAIDETNQIGDVGDPTMSRELLSQVIYKLDSEYRSCNALHQAISQNKFFQLCILKAAIYTWSLGEIHPIQKCACSLLVELVKLEGIHCFAPNQLLTATITLLDTRIQSNSHEMHAHGELEKYFGVVEKHNLMKLLCAKIFQVTAKWGLKNQHHQIMGVCQAHQSIRPSLEAASPDAEILSMFFAVDQGIAQETQNLMGYVYLLVTLVEELPTETLLLTYSVNGRAENQENGDALLETFLSVLQLSRIAHRQNEQDSNLQLLVSLADCALKGITLVLEARNIPSTDTQLLIEKRNTFKASLEAQLSAVPTKRNWNLDSLLHTLCCEKLFASSSIGNIIESLIGFISEGFLASPNVDNSTRRSIDKSICISLIEMVSYAASESCSLGLQDQLATICTFMKQKLENVLFVPETHGLYQYNTIDNTQRLTAMSAVDAEATVVTGLLAIDFFQSLLDTQIGTNVINYMLAEIIPLLMTALIFTRNDVIQQYDESADNYRIVDHPSEVKRQAILRKNLNNESEKIEVEEIESTDEFDLEDDAADVEQCSIRMSAATLLDEISCVYGEAAITIVTLEINKRMVNYANLSQSSTLAWMSLEAAILGLGAIAEGARACFPNNHLLSLIAGTANVAKGNVESHVMTKSISFWCLSKYSLHLLEAVTQPERYNQACESLLVEILSISLDTMKTTESKIIQDAASSCLLTYVRDMPSPSESVKSVFSVIPSFAGAVIETVANCWGRYQLKNKCHLFAIINALAQLDTLTASTTTNETDRTERRFEISLSKIGIYIPQLLTSLDRMIADSSPISPLDERFHAAIPRELKPILPYLLTTCSFLVPYLFNDQEDELVHALGLKWVRYAIELFLSLGQARIQAQNRKEDTDEGIEDILLASIYVITAATANEKAVERTMDPLLLGMSTPGISMPEVARKLFQLICVDETHEILRPDTICEFSLILLSDVLQSEGHCRSLAISLFTAEFKIPFYLFPQLERRICGNHHANDGSFSLLRMMLVLATHTIAIHENTAKSESRVFDQFLMCLRRLVFVSSIQEKISEFQVQKIAEGLIGIVHHEKVGCKQKTQCALCFGALGSFYSAHLVNTPVATVIEITRLMVSVSHQQHEVNGLLRIIAQITAFQAQSNNPQIGDAFLCNEFFDLLMASARFATEEIRQAAKHLLQFVAVDRNVSNELDFQSLSAIRKNYQEFLARLHQSKGANYCRNLFEKLSNSYKVTII
ncbi:Two component regulator three Y domain-containing protein [Perkinsela sp. CCAP 1560/4]|nr:Two component regulator three Y domain-containing protein [Perkinsela sp. CCAP 1560/4]|eukprot:KNH05192.1 Two component regulator three Y domain-containing protein [Perkinsela sp. CCAP 1560/4]